MLFRDYKHIELLEEITIPEKRVLDRKIINVKDWKPSTPFRLRVKATVRKGDKRTIKKRTYIYDGINMVNALKAAGRELDTLLDQIREELSVMDIGVKDDRNQMMTYETAFYRSLEARRVDAIAEGDEFRSYKSAKAFYNNHLTILADIPINEVTRDMINSIRANMKHEVGKKKGEPFSKKTKLSVLQQISPVYTWFNDYSNLQVKNPAKLKRGTIKKLGNERHVKMNDISPLFTAMYNYTFTVFGVEHTNPYREVFIWLAHGRRLNEVLTLDWENINLKDGTYTITAAFNKTKKDQIYKLTKYQMDTLRTPMKKGYVFPARKDYTKKIESTVIWDHWMRVRKVVDTWTLNGKEVDSSYLHMHDLRHLIATELLNKYGVLDEISGAVLGHTRSGITGRYAEIMAESVHDSIERLLDGVLNGN